MQDGNEDDMDGEREIEECCQHAGEFVFTGWGRMNERKYEYVE